MHNCGGVGFEVHKDGTPHLHAVIDTDNIPNIERARNRESLTAYYARQSPAGKLWIDRLCSFGFGPIAHNEKAYGTGRASGKYLVKYLSTGSAVELTHPSGRRMRISEGSRDWRLPRNKTQLYRYSPGGWTDIPYKQNDDTECAYCVTDDMKPEPYIRQHLSRRYAQHWLKPVENNPIFWRELSALHSANARLNRLYSARTSLSCTLDIALAYYIRPPDLPDIQSAWNQADANLEQARRWRDNILDRIRKTGYSGPINLLEVT